MKLKHLELLRKLPVPFETVVDWMNGNPPHPLYLKHMHVLETDKVATILIEDSLEYLQMGMIPPHELFELGYGCMLAFRTMHPEVTDPENDQTMRELAAITFQMVSNTVDCMDRLQIGPCGSPLAHEVVVMLITYLHP